MASRKSQGSSSANAEKVIPIRGRLVEVIKEDDFQNEESSSERISKFSSENQNETIQEEQSDDQSTVKAPDLEGKASRRSHGNTKNAAAAPKVLEDDESEKEEPHEHRHVCGTENMEYVGRGGGPGNNYSKC